MDNHVTVSTEARKELVREAKHRLLRANKEGSQGAAAKTTRARRGAEERGIVPEKIGVEEIVRIIRVYRETRR